MEPESQPEGHPGPTQRMSVGAGRLSRTSSQADGLRGTQTACWSRRKASRKVNLITYKKKSNNKKKRDADANFLFPAVWIIGCFYKILTCRLFSWMRKCYNSMKIDRLDGTFSEFANMPATISEAVAMAWRLKILIILYMDDWVGV